MYDMILGRYGEMTLKKSNYKIFLNQINQNIRRKLSIFPDIKFTNTDYRFYIYLNGVDYKEVLDILDTVVGLHSYSLCKKVTLKDKKDSVMVIDDIASCATEILNEEQKNVSFTFKVETNRANKDFPMTSIQISQAVARLVLPKIANVKVDVHNPDVTLRIDLRGEGTYIYTKVIKGLGGYPSGVAGEGLVMISGGIDSPVATYLAIRKGIGVSLIHYASPPYTSDMALQKVVDIVERLAVFTTKSKIDLYVVPFTKIQDSIHENAKNIFMVTLMRRAMYKIANKFVNEKNISVIINGESIGQVASQTLDSMKVVNEVTKVPIIRPLATFDKEEIITIAKKIKTFDISIRPYEDCCTVFVPEHPAIRPQLEEVIIEENKCNLDELIIDAYNNIKKYTLSATEKTNIFDLEETGKFNI